MNKIIENTLHIVTILVIVISFAVPENYLENTRLNYIIFLFKNSFFEITILLILNLFILLRKNKGVLNFISKIKVELNKNKLFQKTFFINFGILSLILGGTIFYVITKRKVVYQEMTNNYYQQGKYEFEILSKKGDLNNAISSLNSLSLSFNEPNISNNSILKSRSDKLEFKKTLAQRFYKQFESSYSKNGLTRINFMLLLESYCLHPYDILIENEIEKQIKYLYNGYEKALEYYSYLKNRNLKGINDLNKQFPNFYFEQGILNYNIESKLFLKQIKKVSENFSSDDFQVYLNESWQFDKIAETIMQIRKNKSISL